MVMKQLNNPNTCELIRDISVLKKIQYGDVSR